MSRNHRINYSQRITELDNALSMTLVMFIMQKIYVPQHDQRNILQRAL